MKRNSRALLMCVMLCAATEGNSNNQEIQQVAGREDDSSLHDPDYLIRSDSTDVQPASKQEHTSPSTDKENCCTDDQQCEEGFSCWYKIPRGPSAGIPGSIEQPGQCWDNKIIKSLF